MSPSLAAAIESLLQCHPSNMEIYRDDLEKAFRESPSSSPSSASHSSNDGGPAYPHFVLISLPDETKDYRPEPGMSLRDYFAAAALTGLCSATDENGLCTWDTNAAAKLAYEAADAMLTARGGSWVLHLPSPAEHSADTSTHD